MDDLISRQAAIDVVHHTIYEFFDVVEDDDESPLTYKDTKLLELNKSICTRVKDLPSAQPERKKGKWVLIGSRLESRPYACSECNYAFQVDTVMGKTAWNYCPNCGAEMEGEEDA